jgi:hypothetical protein
MRPTKSGLVAQRRHTLCQGTTEKRSIFEDAMVDPPILLLYLTFSVVSIKRWTFRLEFSKQVKSQS